MGTGSGILALYALQKGANYVLATDINQEAIETASFNTKLNKLNNNKIEFVRSDLFDNLKKQRFDFILANLPITDEAWDITKINSPTYWIYKRLLTEVENWLTPDGQLILSFASFGDINVLETFIKDNNLSFTKVSSHQLDIQWYVYIIKSDR